MLVNINSEYILNTDVLPTICIGSGGEMSLWFSGNNINVSVDEVPNRKKVIDLIAKHLYLGTKYLKITSRVATEIVDVEINGCTDATA
jgi:hypothetical protein